MIDLHIHTVASDGQHTGAEIARMAKDLGLRAIAIADHNSVDSVAEAQAEAARLGIDFAPAIELDTIFRGRDLHILGYYIDYQGEKCRAFLRSIFDSKIEQTKKRVAKLQELGFRLDFNDIMRLSGGRLPYGVEYMRALLLHEENKSDPKVRPYIDGDRAFSPYLNFYLDWLKSGRPAFVPLDDLPSERAIAAILDQGGVPVLAHPTDTPEEDVTALTGHGLAGIEVYCSYHDSDRSAHWLQIARRHSLLITAGSDFHGKDRKPNVLLGGVENNSYELYMELKKAAGRA